MTDEEFEQQNEYEDSLQERIKELEEQIEKFKRGEIIPVSVAEQSFKMRDEALALYKNALELALQCIDNESINCKYCIHYTIDGTCNKACGYCPCKEGFKEWLLQQAKENKNEY